MNIRGERQQAAHEAPHPRDATIAGPQAIPPSHNHNMPFYYMVQVVDSVESSVSLAPEPAGALHPPAAAAPATADATSPPHKGKRPTLYTCVDSGVSIIVEVLFHLIRLS